MNREELKKQFENRALQAEYDRSTAEIELEVANKAIESKIKIAVATKQAELEIEIEKLREQLKDAKAPKKEGDK